MSRGKKIFTEEHKAFMREMYPGRTRQELTALFNEHFGLSLPTKQIIHALMNYKIYTHTNYHFTEEQLAFIKENLHGCPRAEMAELVSERFGVQISVAQIQALLSRRRWTNGRDTGFQNGHKGYVNKTSFKKGMVPKHALPIGAERLWKNGSTHIKTASGAWKSKARMVWESIHGSIPPKHVIAFGDGDKSNFDPDNLVLLPQKLLAIMNDRGLIGGSAELTRAGGTIAELVMAINDRKKGACK